MTEEELESILNHLIDSNQSQTIIKPKASNEAHRTTSTVQVDKLI